MELIRPAAFAALTFVLVIGVVVGATALLIWLFGDGTGGTVTVIQDGHVWVCPYDSSGVGRCHEVP